MKNQDSNLQFFDFQIIKNSGLSWLGPYKHSSSIFLSSYITATAIILPSSSQNLSTIFAVLPLLINIATPFACDEKELKIQWPPHYSLTTFSTDLQILVSHTKTKSGFLFFRWWKTFCLFGFLPIELALKASILNFVAELAAPPLVSCVFMHQKCNIFLALWKIHRIKAYLIILYFVHYSFKKNFI